VVLIDRSSAAAKAVFACAVVVTAVDSTLGRSRVPGRLGTQPKGTSVFYNLK
jgi:hypothetical protein